MGAVELEFSAGACSGRTHVTRYYRPDEALGLLASKPARSGVSADVFHGHQLPKPSLIAKRLKLTAAADASKCETGDCGVILILDTTTDVLASTIT